MLAIVRQKAEHNKLVETDLRELRTENANGH
jgi:hypothetical protein